MRLSLRAAALAALLALAPLLAHAQDSQPNLQVKDGNASLQTTLAYSHGGALVVGHLDFGLNPSGVLVPLPVTSGGVLKIDGSATTQPVSGSVSLTGTLPGFASTPTVNLGGTLPAFASTPAFTISGTLPAFAATPSVNAIQSGTWTVQPGNTPNTSPWLFTIDQGGNAATVTAAGALKVDASAVTQPVSGTFWQATQPVSGTFWQATQPVSAAAASFADGASVTTGAEADAACSTDNGSCTTQALLKRLNQRITSLISALGSPLQAGGSIGNTGFAITGTLPAFASTPSFTCSSGCGGATGWNVSVTPTIQNAAYASGNCMGGFQSVSAGSTASVLNQLTLSSKGGLTTAKQLYVFSANPGGSTCTDKSTFTIAAADVGKVIGTYAITPAAPTGTTITFGSLGGLGLGTGSTFYFAIVETASETPASTTDLTVAASGF